MTSVGAPYGSCHGNRRGGGLGSRSASIDLCSGTELCTTTNKHTHTHTHKSYLRRSLYNENKYIFSDVSNGKAILIKKKEILDGSIIYDRKICGGCFICFSVLAIWDHARSRESSIDSVATPVACGRASGQKSGERNKTQARRFGDLFFLFLFFLLFVVPWRESEAKDQLLIAALKLIIIIIIVIVCSSLLLFKFLFWVLIFLVPFFLSGAIKI